MMSIAAYPLSSNLKTLYRLVAGNSFIISQRIVFGGVSLRKTQIFGFQLTATRLSPLTALS
jgi:hypothetical protein